MRQFYFVILESTLLIIICSFFQITDLQHSVLSPLSFRLEYKRGATTTPTMFQRQVRMQVNINDISEDDGGSAMPVHAITFTLLSGNVKLCSSSIKAGADTLRLFTICP